MSTSKQYFISKHQKKDFRYSLGETSQLFINHCVCWTHHMIKRHDTLSLKQSVEIRSKTKIVASFRYYVGLGIRSFPHRSFAHSLRLLKSNEWVGAIRSGCSPKIREWANRSFFWANRSFFWANRSFFWANYSFTHERIPNPDTVLCCLLQLTLIFCRKVVENNPIFKHCSYRGTSIWE